MSSSVAIWPRSASAATPNAANALPAACTVPRAAGEGALIVVQVLRVPFEARRAVISQLTPRTLILMPTLSIVTGTAGWFRMIGSESDAGGLITTAPYPIRLDGSIAVSGGKR